MLNYKLMIEYYEKGNNNSQIATLCGCQRKTVIKVLNKIKELDIEIFNIMKLTDKELYYLLNPKKEKQKDKYLIPDFRWEEFQMVKHQASIRLCWRRYCKRAAKQNLRAYTWKRFLVLYSG